jgi:hypothetical protein
MLAPIFIADLFEPLSEPSRQPLKKIVARAVSAMALLIV